MKEKLIAYYIIVISLFCGIRCQAQDRRNISVNHECIAINSRLDANADSAAISFLAPYKARIDSMMAPVVGHCASDMTSDRPESEMSNLLADILVWGAKEYGERPDFAIYNIGGIRANFSKGEVTIGDVIDVAPFDNRLCFITLRGSSVIKLFKQIGKRGGEGVSSSIRATYNSEGELLSLSVNGKEVKEKGKYRIVTTDYLVEGNDGMTALTEYAALRQPTDSKNNTTRLIMDFFRMKAAAGEWVDAKIEGRLKMEMPKEDKREIIILHSNDTHSQIMPFNKNLTDTTKADRGGFIRRATLVREERNTAPELLLLDSGDFSQGSPYYSLFKGDVEIGLMNLMRYDAAAIGNHEFDFGLENMARLFRKAEFPIVCANYDFTGSPCEGLVKPYTIVERNGLRIGIFGLAPKLDGLVMKEYYGNIRYIPPMSVASDIAATLREKEGCDIVICLSHLGWESGDPEASDEILAMKGKGIDLILGGHSHSLLQPAVVKKDSEGRSVTITQNGKSGCFVSKIVVSVSR